AVFALSMTPDELVFFKAHTMRQAPPSSPISECWLAAGRRGGKSRLAALVAFYLGIRFGTTKLASGETAIIPIIASDRKQSRAVLGYLKALCRLPAFSPYVYDAVKESVTLKNGITVEVMSASLASVRGYTIPAVVLDEIAYWSVEGANPDSEILDAI